MDCARTIEEYGRLDILVNNAGIYPYKPFAEISEEDWDRVLDVNLKGVFLCCKAASRVMENGGKIINMGSVTSFMAVPNLAHYCASKGGVESFTRALALELAPKGINVNAVASGHTETTGTGVIGEGIISKIPLKRVGRPEDMAYLALFLASEYAKNITGQLIVSDGGRTVGLPI